MIASAAGIAQEQRPLTDPADHHVYAAVVIEIAERRAAISRRRTHRYRIERSVGLLHQDAIRLPGRAAGKRFGIFVQIAIGAEQIFAPVVIEIVNAVAHPVLVTVATPTRERYVKSANSPLPRFRYSG